MWKGVPASARSVSRHPGGSPWSRCAAVVNPGVPSEGVLFGSALCLGSRVQV